MALLPDNGCGHYGYRTNIIVLTPSLPCIGRDTCIHSPVIYFVPVWDLVITLFCRTCYCCDPAAAPVVIILVTPLQFTAPLTAIGPAGYCLRSLLFPLLDELLLPFCYPAWLCTCCTDSCTLDSTAQPACTAVAVLLQQLDTAVTLWR